MCTWSCIYIEICVYRMIYHRTGFECVVKWLQMALYKADCNSNDCKLPSRQATPSSSSTILRYERCIVLSLFTLLAWFPNSSRSNAAVTARFTSLRTFGDSCVWLGVGRFTFDLKYWWILISTIDSWTWLYWTVQIRTRVEHLSKRGKVMYYYSLCILFPVILLIARYGKTRNSKSKESHNQNPSTVYILCHNVGIEAHDQCILSRVGGTFLKFCHLNRLMRSNSMWM